MNRRPYFKSLFTSVLLLLGTMAYGQEINDWETGSGEIEEAEVVIEKDKIIRLPQMGRSFEKVPQDEVSGNPPKLEYVYKGIGYTIPDLTLRLRPLTVKPEPLPVVYKGNVKAGFGNFGTPYGQLTYGSGRSDEYQFNAMFRHLSSATGPVDGKNSSNSETIFYLNGSAFVNEFTIGGNLLYQRDGFNFYGYDQSLDVQREDIQQTLNNFTLQGYMQKKSLKDESFYNLGLLFDFVADRLDAQEADFNFNFDGKFAINDNYYVGVPVDFSFTNRRDLLIPSFNRVFLRLNPFLEFKNDNLSTKVGFTGVVQDDTIQNAKDFHFFPFLEAKYRLSDNVQVYAGLTGDVDKQTLKTYLNRNRFLNSNVDVFHNINTIDFYGGVVGKAGRFGYDAGISVSYYKNMFFFINSPVDTTKFDIVYDTGTTNVNNFFAKLSYQAQENVILGFEGNYYFYQTDSIAQPWHKPQYDLLFLSQFNILDKFTIGVDAYLMGGIKALGPTSGAEVNLDPIFDLIVKLDYHLSERASIFLNGYNLLGNEYQRFLNYPHRGFQVLGGVSFSF